MTAPAIASERRFERFRRRILLALDAAEPVGISEPTLLRVLDSPADPVPANRLAGALSWMQRARLVTRGLDLNGKFVRLGPKGRAALPSRLRNPATASNGGRVKSSNADAAPPPIAGADARASAPAPSMPLFR